MAANVYGHSLQSLNLRLKLSTIFLSVIALLFQYQYNSSPANEIVPTLMQITINTVDAHMHQCKEHDETMAPPSPFVPRHRGSFQGTV